MREEGLQVFKPYDYQEACLTAIQARRDAGKQSALVVMASGLGKTAISAFDVGRWLEHNPKARVLYLCHQNDILVQACKTFRQLLGSDRDLYGFYYGGVRQREAKYLFASFQTMKDRLFRFAADDFDYLVVDEAHHAQAKSFRPVIKHFKPKFTLGLTATPERLDGKEISEIFGPAVFSLPLEKALAQGLLARVDYRLVTDELAEIGTIHEPHTLSLEELNRRIFLPKRDAEIVRILKAKMADMRNPRVMIFCPTIEHTKRLAKLIPGALVVHSRLAQRYQSVRLRAFKLGAFSVVLAVDKFNEGIDIPPLNVIVFLRLTQSKRIFYQQLGRGLRKIAGKDKVVVLDFVANCQRVKLVHELVSKVQQTSDALGGNKMGKPTYSALKALALNEFTVAGGRFEFSEQAVKIIEWLEKSQPRARPGHSRQILIAELKAEAQKLGSSPTYKDIRRAHKEGRTASYGTFVKYFGSFTEALKDTGLPVTQRGRTYPQTRRSLHRREAYTRAAIIEQLKAEAKRLGRAPISRDIRLASKAGRTVSVSAILYRFFTFSLALRAAGLRPKREWSPTPSRIDKCIEQIHEEAKRLGRMPSAEEIKTAIGQGRISETASYYYTEHGGSWDEVLRVIALIDRAEAGARQG